jgi:hypothetical protein
VTHLRPSGGDTDSRARINSGLCASAPYPLSVSTGCHSCRMATPDLPAADLPAARETFTAGRLSRRPIGGPRVELHDGELVWIGEFDQQGAVPRRVFLGRRARTEPGQTVPRSGAGGQQRRFQPWSEEESRRDRVQLAADRSEYWAATVANYAADPDDMDAAWEYLQSHPIFWSWVLPLDLADVDPMELDEAQWARVEAESLLNRSSGMYQLIIDTSRWREPDATSPTSRDTAIRLEHGPMLWPLDVHAEHRAGFWPGGTPSHDPDLDVAERTWEAAILALAVKVRTKYGDDRARVAYPPRDTGAR